jgi:hypothetical protein
MTFPAGTPVIDTMIAFPQEGTAQYDFIREHVWPKFLHENAARVLRLDR